MEIVVTLSLAQIGDVNALAEAEAIPIVEERLDGDIDLTHAVVRAFGVAVVALAQMRAESVVGDVEPDVIQQRTAALIRGLRGVPGASPEN